MIRRLFLLALAGALVAACTDSLVEEGSHTANLWGGEAYVSFEINLPVETATRAANDQFEDGDAVEYNVQDATLLLFVGRTEDEATFWQECTVSDGFTTNTTPGQITSSVTTVVNFEKPDLSQNNLYALVMLNADGILDELTLTKGVTTFSSLQTEAVEITDISSIASTESGGYFYMTNAPLSDTRGGYHNPSGLTVSTLSHVDAAAIGSTEEEAKSHPATEVYVERGVAKVTVTADDVSSNISGLESGVTIDGFALDQTNTKMYPVRSKDGGSGDNAWWHFANSSVEDYGQYRFVGNVEAGANLYRTYWAQDPNYGSDASSDLTSASDESEFIPTGSAAYCLENTFSVNEMNRDQTTGVVIKATLNGGNDFFLWDGDVYSEDEIEEEICSYIAEEIDGIGITYTGEGNFADQFSVSYDGTASTDEMKFTVTYTGDISDLSNIEGTEDVESYIEEALENLEVEYYKGGVAYYWALIEHFGDELTPWSWITDGYDYTAENHLGRYGVLRNNWYQLNVKAVNEIGYPTVISLITEAHHTGHTDDEPVEYGSIGEAVRGQGISVVQLVRK